MICKFPICKCNMCIIANEVVAYTNAAHIHLYMYLIYINAAVSYNKNTAAAYNNYVLVRMCMQVRYYGYIYGSVFMCLVCRLAAIQLLKDQ